MIAKNQESFKQDIDKLLYDFAEHQKIDDYRLLCDLIFRSELYFPIISSNSELII